MSIMVQFSGLRRIKAVSNSAGKGNAWFDIVCIDRDGNEQEITLFCDSVVLAGRLAQAINQAQNDHDLAKEGE